MHILLNPNDQQTSTNISPIKDIFLRTLGTQGALRVRLSRASKSKGLNHACCLMSSTPPLRLPRRVWISRDNRRFTRSYEKEKEMRREEEERWISPWPKYIVRIFYTLFKSGFECTHCLKMVSSVLTAQKKKKCKHVRTLRSLLKFLGKVSLPLTMFLQMTTWSMPWGSLNGE